VNRDGRIAGDRWIERWASVDGCDFGPRANEGVHFVAERLLEVSGDLGFKGNGVGCAGGENHIATGDEGFDVGEFKGLKAGTQDILLTRRLPRLRPRRKAMNWGMLL